MKRATKILTVFLVCSMGLLCLTACSKEKKETSGEKTELVVVPSETSTSETSASVTSRLSSEENSSDGRFSIREAIEQRGGLQVFTQSITKTVKNDDLILSCDFNGDDQIEIVMMLKKYLDPDTKGVKEAFSDEFDKMKPQWAEQIISAEKENVRPFTYAIRIVNTDGSVLYDTVISEYDI